MASSVGDGPPLPGESTDAGTPRWAALSGLIVVLAATTLVGALHPSLPKLGGTPVPFAIRDPGPGGLGGLLPPSGAPGQPPYAGTTARRPAGSLAGRAAIPARPTVIGVRAVARPVVISAAVFIQPRSVHPRPGARAPVTRVPVAPLPAVPVSTVPVPVVPVSTFPVPGPARPTPARPAPARPAPVAAPAPVVPAPVVPVQLIAVRVAPVAGQLELEPVPVVTTPIAPADRQADDRSKPADDPAQGDEGAADTAQQDGVDEGSAERSAATAPDDGTADDSQGADR